MKECSKCKKSLKDESIYCPYCGSPVESNNFQSSHLNPKVESISTIEKQISKKSIVIVIVISILIVIVGSILICEEKIAKAKSLYVQSEYWKAYMQIDGIPTFGREDLIRIKAAAYAGSYYDSYLTTKRIRLSNTSAKSKDAYQSAFWDLIFGLYIDLRTINNEQNDFSSIELDEYKKFVDLFYSELSSMFHMSRSEADTLVKRFDELSSVDDEKSAAYRWLDENFFSY